MMKCHYEILDVPKDADDSQIKTAYRRLALKWHPDKNLENVEGAKVEFQLVQQAYEVLSDRQERAWYDKHREQILYGRSNEYKESDIDIFKYFTSSCFSGYGDDENGFYTVYRKAFEEIIQDDIQHMLDKDDLLDVPSFGTSTSDYEEVVGPFYDYWTSYSTKKSFVWLDQYNIQEVQRRVLKLIEKEHKKIRQKAKKEWNDEVRALVAFVKKRDKRVKEYAKVREAKILENRQKNEELSKRKRLERKKLLNDSHDLQAEWTKFDNVKNELEQIEKHLAKEFGDEVSEHEEDDEDVTDIDLNNLYCVACNKIFKSAKAFENHELSKKHKENVLKLKETMEDEECTESDDQASEDSATLQHEIEIEISNTEEELSDSLIEKQVKQKKKQKKIKNLTRESISEDDINNSFLHCDNSEDDFKFEDTKQKNKSKKNKTSKTDSSRNPTNTATNVPEQSVQNDSAARPTDQRSIKNTKTPLKNGKSVTENKSEGQNDTSNSCVTCKADFPSKNKLFNHLKKTGHSVYIPQETQSTRSMKNKRLEK